MLLPNNNNNLNAIPALKHAKFLMFKSRNPFYLLNIPVTTITMELQRVPPPWWDALPCLPQESVQAISPLLLPSYIKLSSPSESTARTPTTITNTHVSLKWRCNLKMILPLNQLLVKSLKNSTWNWSVNSDKERRLLLNPLKHANWFILSMVPKIALKFPRPVKTANQRVAHSTAINISNLLNVSLDFASRF